MKQYLGLTIVSLEIREGSNLRIPGFSFWLCFLDQLLKAGFASEAEPTLKVVVRIQ